MAITMSVRLRLTLILDIYGNKGRMGQKQKTTFYTTFPKAASKQTVWENWVVSMCSVSFFSPFLK